MMASVTLTSCQDFWDDLFGEESNPSTPTTPSTPSEPEDDGSVTLTDIGATLKVEKLSDITELLNQIKSDIASKVGEEYVVEIVGEGLKATSDDNTVSVPKVEKSNINLSFANALTTEVPLLVKTAEGSTQTIAINQLTITMPTSEGLKLEVYMPETVVTLKAASGTVVYDEVIATTANSNYWNSPAASEGIKSAPTEYDLRFICLFIENGITIKTLQANTDYWSSIMIKGDSKIETYAYMPAPNNEGKVLIEADYDNQVNWLWIVNPSGYSYIFTEKDGVVKHYGITHLKVVKGKADYAVVDVTEDNENLPLEKLTIAEGAVLGRQARSLFSVKTIEAEGNGAEMVLYNGWPTKVMYDDGSYDAVVFGDLSCMTEIKGISLLSVELREDQGVPDILADANDISFSLLPLSCNLENCTFNFDNIVFKGKTTTDYIKGCKFENSHHETSHFNISIPLQTEETPSYQLNFTDCDFSKGFTFSLAINYHMNEDSEMTQCDNYYATIVIKNCQLGDTTITTPSDLFTEGMPVLSDGYIPEGMHLRLDIDGILYETVLDNENWEYSFVPVQ